MTLKLVNINNIKELVRDTKIRYREHYDIDYDSTEDLLTLDVSIVHNKFLQVIVYLDKDLWDFHMHRFICSHFNVELIDYKIEYTASSTFDHVMYQYVYTSEGYAEPLDWDCRYSHLDILELRDDKGLYYPDEDCRILTHRILKYLREFDNIGFNYNKYLDNIELQSFLGQCECWSEHISKKK